MHFRQPGRKPLRFRNLETKKHRAFLFNPGDGTKQDLAEFTADSSCGWQAPEFPIFRDWVVVLDQRVWKF